MAIHAALRAGSGARSANSDSGGPRTGRGWPPVARARARLEQHAMLKIEALTVDIETSRILRGISLDVGAGELVCLVGRNGAGKTTTFRAVMGFLQPVSGEIRFDGGSIAGQPTHKIAQLGVGYSPEESQVFGDLSVA